MILFYVIFDVCENTQAAYLEVGRGSQDIKNKAGSCAMDKGAEYFPPS